MKNLTGSDLTLIGRDGKGTVIPSSPEVAKIVVQTSTYLEFPDDKDVESNTYALYHFIDGLSCENPSGETRIVTADVYVVAYYEYGLRDIATPVHPVKRKKNTYLGLGRYPNY